ncbi:MAG TPA: hypothetical protein EYG74_03305 [Sulfurimonas autotrophica]|nr:hypothetical protein [Sulfurimonas autotrophica]
MVHSIEQKNHKDKALIPYANRHYSDFSLELVDDIIHNENEAWKMKEEKLYKKKQKEKASDIDF